MYENINDPKVGITRITKLPCWMMEASELNAVESTSEEWLVRNCLPSGVLAYMVADSGCSKTFIALDLAIKLCAEEENSWLGQKIMLKEPASVIYIDQEMTSFKIKNRINQIGSVERLEGRFIYAPQGGFNICDETYMDELYATVVQRNVKLVIIDSLIRIHNLDENNSAEMKSVAEKFYRFKQLGCTILVLHHTNKMGDTRGSVEIKAGSDIIINIKRYGKSFAFTLTKFRDIADDDVPYIRYELPGKTGERFSISVLENNKESIVDRIVNYVAENDGCNKTDIAMSVGGKKSVTLQAIDKLVQAKQLVMEPGIRGAKLYHLADTVAEV